MGCEEILRQTRFQSEVKFERRVPGRFENGRIEGKISACQKLIPVTLMVCEIPLEVLFYLTINDFRFPFSWGMVVGRHPDTYAISLGKSLPKSFYRPRLSIRYNTIGQPTLMEHFMEECISDFHSCIGRFGCCKAYGPGKLADNGGNCVESNFCFSKVDDNVY